MVFFNERTITEGGEMHEPFSLERTERVYSTSDSFQKERVQEILNENHIEYKIRARDDSRRNPFDQAGLGSLGNNRLLVTYSFYVDKKDAEWAVRLIHSQV